MDNDEILPEVACLEAFWASLCEGAPPMGSMVVKVLLDTLGLGNQQVYRFLLSGENPTFQQFRQWIAETAGQPDPLLLSRYHAWLYEIDPEAEAQADLDAIAAMPPVLDEAALAHWDREGYVILHDAITAEEAAAVRDLIWLETGASPAEPESWRIRLDDGIMIARFQHPALMAARTSPRIRKAFAQLWGSENLWVTNDRIGFNPPVTDQSPFTGSDLHWDVSLARPIPFGTQAVLYLHEVDENQGAFRCVPGFHHEIDAFLDDPAHTAPRQVDLSARQRHVAGRTGDLVIWRQDLPHGASPNMSDKPRLVQYLNFYSPDMQVHPRWL